MAEATFFVPDGLCALHKSVSPPCLTVCHHNQVDRDALRTNFRTKVRLPTREVQPRNITEVRSCHGKDRKEEQLLRCDADKSGTKVLLISRNVPHLSSGSNSTDYKKFYKTCTATSHYKPFFVLFDFIILITKKGATAPNSDMHVTQRLHSAPRIK